MISIIMGIYNCADTLTEALDSIANQTYTDWELIMCDDGSSDKTYKVAEKYNGGGHMLASGAKLASLEQLGQLLQDLKEIINE